MPIERLDTGPSFARTAAGRLAEMIRHAIRVHGDCIMGLSGGSTPGPVYAELAKEMIDWSRVTVFLADDRCVTPDHPHSNQLLVRSTLLAHTAARPRVIFPDMSRPPDEAATEYARRLEELLADRPADIVTLGMGPDGHIASLFPPLDDRAFGPALAIHTVTDVFDVHDRISVTLPVLRKTARAVFLLKGTEKQDLWNTMESSGEDVRRWPAKEVVAAGNVTVVMGEGGYGGYGA